ncbi:MAG: hypothetical protein K9M57_03560 [Phycisphaerae bacterium]|nr:hypothetical protein [Phycisphaerae bacterium]
MLYEEMADFDGRGLLGLCVSVDLCWPFVELWREDIILFGRAEYGKMGSLD